MKRYLTYFVAILLIALAGFYTAKFEHRYSKAKASAKRHKKEKENITFYPVIEAKPFVVIIPSYNNEEIYEKNLQSVFEQKYGNYRIIYIDDCSKDKTYERVQKFIRSSQMEDRVTLIRNEKNLGPLENIYRASISCRDEEIIIILDGDDWLAHDRVLEKLNQEYANPNVWLTYGSYLTYPQYTKGECSRPIPTHVFKEKALRKYCKEKGATISHLRTYYAGLFKKIKLQDLLENGNFFGATADGATMIPMIEMARKHYKFIPEVLHIYNRTNPLNEDKVHFEKQQKVWHTVLSMPMYPKLDYLTFPIGSEIYQADVVVFSYNRPMQLYAYLESLHKYTKNLGRVSVIYRANQQDFAQGYEEVKQLFPHILFYKQSDRPYEDFKPLVLQAAFSGPSEYVLFAVDDIIVKDLIDFNEAIQAMHLTQAKGFYFRLGKNVDYCYAENQPQGIPSLIGLDNNIYAWQFQMGKCDWKYPCCLDMTLYKKDEIEEEVECLEFQTPNTLESQWAKIAKMNQVGLCYEMSKIVNVPVNLVNENYANRHMHSYSPEELLAFFNKGLKIDISEFFQIDNHSAHIEHPLHFIPR
jgi:glycosyltransferase involved in cell wall biosynthesis